MAPRKLYNFYIDPDLAEGLKKLKEERQRSEGQIVRDALREYLERKGVMNADRKRTGARKRP